jgi:ribosomal protein L11 methyltransferase
MKTNQPLWRVSVTTSLAAEDAVMELLGSTLGAPASAYFNLETGVSIVSVYLTGKKGPGTNKKAAIFSGLARMKSVGLDPQPGTVEIRGVRREDWAESWKRHFKAMEIGKALLVKPSWVQKSARRNQAVVILDPGLSFGTGQHATTSFCLSEIVRLHKTEQPKSFLDIGTGSGILAISAAKLGCQPVEAFDFDPESVRVARANSAVNGVANKIKLSRLDVTKLPLHPAKQFDLVCANLISNLLMAERKRIVNRVKPDGTLVLAGILAVEFGEVQAAFESLGWKLVADKIEKEWRSGAFQFLRNVSQQKV